MLQTTFPEMIEQLPDIDLNLEGVRGKLLQAGDKQLVFFEIDPMGQIPPHSHRAQWGVVLEGELELTIGDDTRIYTKGDSYFIPAGTVHSARIISKVKLIDMFDEPARYQPRS